MVPHYGIFSKFYFSRLVKSMHAAGDKYSNFKKNVGPPNYQYAKRYMPLEHNDYL